MNEWLFWGFFIIIVAAIGIFYWQQAQNKKLTDASPVKVLQYQNMNDANLGIAAMVQDGWIVKGIDTTEGHINVGRTATWTILTGGIALLLGGSRTPGKITVLFERGQVEEPSAAADSES